MTDSNHCPKMMEQKSQLSSLLMGYDVSTNFNCPTPFLFALFIFRFGRHPQGEDADSFQDRRLGRMDILHALLSKPWGAEQTIHDNWALPS